MNILPQPVPLSESTAHYYDGWAKRVKDLIDRGEIAVRLSQTGLAIEGTNIGNGATILWGPTMLPNSGTQFASEQDRQVVYEMITGAREIPEAQPQST